MSLRELQHQWQAGVFDEKAQPIVQHIINPEERALIYVDSYRARLIETLEKTFLLLYQKMGDDNFCELALNYIDAHPSESFSIAQFGRQLPLFLREGHEAELADVAELDWAIFEALDAKTKKCLTREDLQTIPEAQWENVVFELHPSLRLVNKYRVYRKGLQIFYVEISAQEKQVLESIQQQKTFGKICESLSETLSEEEVANYLIQQIVRWLDDELITAIAVKEIA